MATAGTGEGGSSVILFRFISFVLFSNYCFPRELFSQASIVGLLVVLFRAVWPNGCESNNFFFNTHGAGFRDGTPASL